MPSPAPGAGPVRRVLVVTHAVREQHGRAMLRLVVDRLAARRIAVSFLVWDRGMVAEGAIGDRDGPRREIEAVNRWRLPQVLARRRAVSAARMLRNGRLRWWWRRLGPVDAVLIVDPVRPEMAHYLPPGSHRVGLLLTGRPLEPAEDLARSRELADVMVAAAASVPAGTADATFADLVDALPGEPAPTDAPWLVVGLGPADWRAGPELFVRVAAAVRDRATQPVRFAWLGMDPDDGRSFPYRHDAARLGLAHDLEMTDEPDVALALLGAARAVVLTARAPHPLPVHPWCDEIAPDQLLAGVGVPVVAFATPGADALAPTDGPRVPFPDVDALADEVLAALPDAPANRLADQVDRLLDTLLVAGP